MVDKLGGGEVCGSWIHCNCCSNH